MIFNADTGTILARHPHWAFSFSDRLLGMIVRRFDDETLDAMIFGHCNAVHTMWMRFPLDLVFVDAMVRVTALHADVAPWRIASGGKRACSVIELPAGTIRRSGTEIGHQLNLNSNFSAEAIEKIQSGVILNAVPCSAADARSFTK